MNYINSFIAPEIFLALSACLFLIFRNKKVWAKSLFYLLCLISIFSLSFLPLGKGETLFSATFIMIIIFAMSLSFAWSKENESIAILIYGLSAVGLIRQNNLLMMFCFIEMMMMTASYIIFSGKSSSSRAAGLRYLKVHIIAGIFILLGIIAQYETSGSLICAVSFNSEIDFNDARSCKRAFIAIGLLINAAIFPFSAWLPDSYPKASNSGSVALSVFTTKISIFLLAKIYWGMSIFVPIGIITVVYASIYMVMVNNFKRVSSYFIIMQNGLLLAVIGVGGGGLLDAFPYILSASTVYCFFSMYITSYIAEKKSTEYFIDLKIKDSFEKSFYVMLIGCVFIVGLPLTLSGITKKLAMVFSDSIYLSIVANYMMVPIVIATLGKLFLYKQYHKKFRLRLNLREDSIFMMSCMALMLLGAGGSFYISHYILFSDFITKILGSILIIYISIRCVKLLENKKYELSLDVDWLYRVFLFRIYKIAMRPVHKARDFIYNNGQHVAEKFLQENRRIFFSFEYTKIYQSISWVVIGIFLWIIFMFVKQ